ncbi:MAG: hypothetical protein M3Y21_07980 [Candidatus Eremiobacteraeota bacterium]|nr:hypothetical protein [Candidatus Eremiobacteraeota bacterium]
MASGVPSAPGGIGLAFERAVDELSHDSMFADVEFVAHHARRNGRTTSLVVMVDREGGVDISLCGRIAAILNAKLEDSDDPYTLEVESAGLSRPLTRPGDYERFKGKAVKVLTTLLVKGGKTHRGTLRGVRGTNVILETTKGELPLPLATIKSANIEYDIRADLKREKEERKNHG